MIQRNLFSESAVDDRPAVETGSEESADQRTQASAVAMVPEPSTPHVAGSRTSRNAATSAKRFATSQAERLWAYINSCGADGCTDKEAQEALKMPGDSQRPRRVWLFNNHFIDQRDVLRNGCSVWVAVKQYPPTEAN